MSSALMGTISGSGVANVLTTGQFTIPLMKRFGYSGVRRRGRGHLQHGRPDHAAGDGRGGLHHGREPQRALCRIVKAAAIPAILYYVTAFWMVHLEAGRKNLLGLPKDRMPQSLACHARATGT
jgi:TRAP-type uncharacterized transport system fused permease subunit